MLLIATISIVTVKAAMIASGVLAGLSIGGTVIYKILTSDGKPSLGEEFNTVPATK